MKLSLIIVQFTNTKLRKIKFTIIIRDFQLQNNISHSLSKNVF